MWEGDIDSVRSMAEAAQKIRRLDHPGPLGSHQTASHGERGSLLRGQRPEVRISKEGDQQTCFPPDPRLPITKNILDRILLVGAMKGDRDAQGFMAAAALGYYGFMRISELFISKGAPNQGLRLRNVSVSDGTLSLRLESSKGDKEGRGAFISIAPTGERGCPLRLLTGYLASRTRWTADEPLFLLEDGSPMGAAWFRAKLKQSCEEAGFIGNFNGHSLRIGAATDAFHKGLPPYTIKMLGRWRSNAYLQYLQPSSSGLAAV